MLRSLRAFFLFLLLTASLPAFSQNQDPLPSPKGSWSYGVNGYYGAFFRYRSGLSLLNYSHLHGVELYANKQTSGRRFWEPKYKLPSIGFALAYFNYMVPQELGKSVAVTSYLDGPITKIGKGSLRYNLGTGLVYSTMYYNSTSNENNKAIGSPLTFSLRGNLRYEYPVHDRLFLNVIFGFRHFSNGSLNQSNNGMNMPLLGLGVRYGSKPPVAPAAGQDPTAPELDKRVRMNIRLAAGVKEVLRDDFKHQVYMMSAFASKRVTHTNSFLLGADAIHDTAIGEEYLNKGVNYPEGYLDKRTAGIFVGHELHVGNLAAVFHFGRYIYQPHHLFPDYYQRYGLKYQLFEHLSASALLMAHDGHANVIEWGLGFHL
ncbi:acyloxyacyl hydrolase [Rufibacter radiotolerans]|uniref:acyloxyacyl hydrolase n=1 Tax=Rufibacter radiotolerans TaxID=1379910 RepID=UPI0009E337FF|nr:acyloxyacyl hydrolase [Rufibacter radiotolerans]